MAWYGLRRFIGKAGTVRKAGEQGAEYYDQAFSEVESFRAHYTRSPYYSCWTVILDRLRQVRPRSIIEIGCGPGQLASAIRDARVVDSYYGFDFSKIAIGYAREACPEFRFEIDNALTTSLLEEFDYDAAVSTEFLEHIEDDLLVVSRLKPRTYFIGTVPNFPYVSHVRHFRDGGEVSDRYGREFEDFRVAEILGDENGKTFFLMEGIKN